MSLMDLSDVVDDLSDELSLTVTRPAASSYTGGRLDTPSTSTFQVNASSQPAGGRDLERLPEGSRVSDAQVFFTSTELRGLGPSQGPDQIAMDGETYEVQNVQAWGNVGNYWRVVALKTGN